MQFSGPNDICIKLYCPISYRRIPRAYSQNAHNDRTWSCSSVKSYGSQLLISLDSYISSSHITHLRIECGGLGVKWGAPSNAL